MPGKPATGEAVRKIGSPDPLALPVRWGVRRLLGEPLTASMLLGGAIALTGVMIVTRG